MKLDSILRKLEKDKTEKADILVVLPKDLKEKIQTTCEKNNITMTRLITHLLEQFAKENNL